MKEPRSYFKGKETFKSLFENERIVNKFSFQKNFLMNIIFLVEIKRRS